jgi:hypothetical protein
MADINYFDVDSIKQIITLVKAEDKKKLELSIVNALPAIANAKQKTIYLVNLNKTNNEGKQVYGAYIYNGIEYLSFGEIGSNTQVTTLLTPTVSDVGKVVQYIGITTANYIHNYFYECIDNNGTYEWSNVSVQPMGTGDSAQVSTMPLAAIDQVGKILQYTGATTQDFTHGFFYECQSDGLGGYEWVPVNVGASVQSITSQELAAMWND